MHLILLGLALLPYAVLAGVDTWMHERSRVVPPVEKILHAGLGVSLIAFLIGAFTDRNLLALIALGVFAIFLCMDEFGFHGHLARRERYVHFASYAALLGFIVTWHSLGVAA